MHDRKADGATTVSHEDLLTAWNELWRRSEEWGDMPVVQPDFTNRYDLILWQGLERVIKKDRERRAND